MLLMFLNFIIFILAAAVLAKSAVFLIDTLTRIALTLRVSEYLVGFVIMAFAASLPDLSVGIASAIQKKPILSLGNVIGTGIADPTLILGLAALIAGGLRVQTHVRNREIFYANLSVIAPLVMLLDGKLTRNEGLILLLFFVLLVYNLVLQSREYTKIIADHRPKRSLFKEFGFFGLGIAFLLGSAWVLVKSGETIAVALGIPTILIGLFVITLGTSLPELSFSILAAIKRQGALVMGAILGCVVTDATLVLGITALIHPITLSTEDFNVFLTSGGALIFALLIFTLFVRSEYKISKKEALALVLGYLVFVIAELFYGMRG